MRLWSNLSSQWMLVAALSVLPRLLVLCAVALFWLVDLVLEHMVKSLSRVL